MNGSKIKLNICQWGRIKNRTSMEREEHSSRLPWRYAHKKITGDNRDMITIII